MDHPSHLLRELQGRARKRFGQHFLASEGVLDRIIAAAEIGPGSRVLEIGPGLGALTERLLAAGAEVLAVELDRDLAAFLRDRHADQPALRILEADAAKLDWGAVLDGDGWRCVANLPYNVGTTITTSLLRRPDRLDRLVLMLQREVALRMVAPAGARNRGSLSVFVEGRAAGSVAVKVPPGAFHPPPKVHSTVIRLDLFDAPDTGGVDADHLESVVRLGFAAPRKKLRNPLSRSWPRERVDAALTLAGVASARPGDLTLVQWQRVAAELPPRGEG
jgi:16S rRNA (adenine1518-N6/adenine1519-N6)-dimethyltransferase